MFVCTYLKDDGTIDCINYYDVSECENFYNAQYTATMFQIIEDEYNGLCRRLLKAKCE